MKKLVLLLIAGILCFDVSAQSGSPVGANIVVKGGYNFLEKQPVSQLTLFGDFAFVRFAINFNYAFAQKEFDEPMRFPAFSPSLGLTYGYKNKVYFMCDAQPWGVWNETKNKVLPYERWRCSLEAGYDICLTDWLFFNISALYLIPSRQTEQERPCQNLSLMAGFGFRL